MFVLATVFAVVIGGFLLTRGVGKLSGGQHMARVRERLGLNVVIWKAIGVLEVFGATGVLLGLLDDLAIIGVLAAVGLVLLTIGAVHYHQKAGDATVYWLPAVVMGSLAIFYVIARVASS